MPVSSHFTATLISTAILAAAVTATMTTASAQPNSGAHFAADTLSGGTKIRNPSAPPPLHLTAAQKEQIRIAIDHSPSDVVFPLGTPGAEAKLKFTPTVGAPVPKKLVGQTLPASLTAQMPVLRQYMYVKLADKAVIVDPLNHKVAEIIPLP